MHFSEVFTHFCRSLYVSSKCAATTGVLARIMPNLGGPSQEMRVVRSIALNVAPIWAKAKEKKTYVTGVDGAYRRSALRVMSAFRILSTDAGLVIEGMIMNVSRSREEKIFDK